MYTTTHIADEATLATQCGQGNRIAQRQLFDAYADYMMVVCTRYIINREDAREVMLDGFVNVYKNIDRFAWQGTGSLKAWIRKIMVNQCLMWLRKKNHMLADAEMIDYSNEPQIDGGAVERLSMKELMEEIHRLPDGYRTVFNLYVFEQMSHKEIGAALGISENTSKSQLHKAKALLQKNINNTNSKL